MSVYQNVTEHNLISLSKSAEQWNNQRAIRSKIKILKQTHDKNIADSFTSINKKIEEVDKSIRKKEVLKKRKHNTSTS